MKKEVNESRLRQVEPWMRGVLLMAGIYNLIWGILIFSFPNQFYSWLTESEAHAGRIIEYQGIGVLLFSFLYLLSCLYPSRLWFLIVFGILSKIIGAFLAYFFLVDQVVTSHFVFHVLVNDLAWVIPFSFIARRAYCTRKNRFL